MIKDALTGSHPYFLAQRMFGCSLAINQSFINLSQMEGSLTVLSRQWSLHSSSLPFPLTIWRTIVMCLNFASSQRIVAKQIISEQPLGQLQPVWIHKVYLALAKGMPIAFVLPDLSAAFDNIDHVTLIDCLASWSVSVEQRSCGSPATWLTDSK